MDRGIQKSVTILGLELGGFFLPIANASFLPPTPNPLTPCSISGRASA